jgi:serine/threonine protein kinase
LLTNSQQKEIAEQLNLDGRTVRRRITAIREIVKGQFTSAGGPIARPSGAPESSIIFTNISYRQFVLAKLVGRGTLGKVYRARLQSDGQVVAVKFMHRYLWTDLNRRCLFLGEIDHVLKFDHPGIAKYLGWGQSPHSGPNLVCAHFDGQPLTHIRTVDSSTSQQWLAQVCEAVAAAYHAGVIHGDLSPNNVLREHNRLIVITDVGFATDKVRGCGRFDLTLPRTSGGSRGQSTESI